MATDENTATPPPPELDAGAFKGFIALARPFWVSEEKWLARGTLALVISLSLGLVFVSVRLNEWNKVFFNAMERHDFDAFFYLLGSFVVLMAVYAAVAVHLNYFQQGLEVRWRRWLTRYFIDRWLDQQNYYQLQLQSSGADNPDQRIAEDVRLFTSLTVSLFMGFLSSAVTVVSFTAILWNLSGVIEVPLWTPFGTSTFHVHGYMVWAAVVYSVIGTIATNKIGMPLVKLNFLQQSLEANFRFSMVRVRENADGIAFYRGEDNLRRALGMRFQSIYDNFLRIMLRQKRIAWLTITYGQTAAILPLLLAAPRYLSGAITLGGLTQSAAAFIQIQSALSWFVNIYGNYADWRATLDRLRDFTRALDRYTSASTLTSIDVITGPGRELTVEHLLLEYPDGKPMLRCDALRVVQGESVILMGASGSGKSTLMRAVARMWPFGHGRIVKPLASMMFMPQRPYLQAATLREIVGYPARPGVISDEAIVAALESCGLAHLTSHLDETQNWTLALSMGEQQRVGFTRALLQKPDWLFLDESTSALDVNTERMLYHLLRERLPDSTLFSISHRPGLTDYHERILRTRERDGQWKLEEGEIAPVAGVPPAL